MKSTFRETRHEADSETGDSRITKNQAEQTLSLVWWGKMDSNHRRHCQQIYSLSPLATREFPHMKFCLSRSSKQNPSQRSCDEKKNGWSAYKAFAAQMEEESNELRLPMELVDGFEPPTC